ncbi:MAG TPA: arginase family protein [Candidatus Acidoferrales bacterium]|nr:arginase family protein [Candidatus Acidoferrales bacterium]
MAVKITRQSKNIALLGSPTSAAGVRAGHERAPAALRAAGIVDRLKGAGFQVADHGDTATYAFQADDEHPRARNVPAILKSLNDLRPRVEVAVKSGALPLILSGDCISVMGVIAGTRRYYRNVSLIYMDRDADLNVPATTPSGCVDGMVVAQIIGRGAPELVRFWGEPPLVREPDVALFGFERLDPPEEKYLVASPLRRHPSLEVTSVGAAAAARLALERVHAANHEFILHFDVDVINSGEFPWTDFPGAGGLTLSDARDALRVFASQTKLAAFVVGGYNPDLDPDGAGARRLIDLLTEALSSRIAVEPVAGAVEPAAPAAELSHEPPGPQNNAPETAEPTGISPPAEQDAESAETTSADLANTSEPGKTEP